jgi:GntR family transcriptional regulator
VGANLSRRKGGKPLYAQAAELLRERIVRGDLAFGARLDSEPELAKQLGVSRATVSKALDILASDGLVSREQGRGTFVRRPRLDRGSNLTSFTQNIAQLGHKPSQRVLDHYRAFASPDDALLAQFPNDELLFVLRRIRLVDDEPFGIHRSVIPDDIAEQIGLEERLRTGGLSLYALFGEHNFTVATAEDRLRAANSTAEEAALLGLKEGTALMVVRRFSYDATGRLIEAVDARYDGSWYEYHVELVSTRTPTRIRNEQQQEPDEQVPEQPDEPDEKG